MMFDPPKPFIRRIWAGGELEWVHGNMLLVGAMATETTRSNSVEEITTSAGDDMLVVRVEKKFSNRRGPALLDRRYAICALLQNLLEYRSFRSFQELYLAS